jgi:intraflagellar transport protein 172
MAMQVVAGGIEALGELKAKLALALLRHTDVVPADKAFYLAGMACNAAGWENTGFVCLNRYLDLVEAIEEGSLDALDNADFKDTDVPFEIPLPDEHYLPEQKRAEVKEWLLAVCMDKKIEQTLDRDERGVYIGSLRDPKTGRTSEACAVSGFPVLTSVAYGSKVGNKPDWNKFIMASKSSHSDSMKDVLRFLKQWAAAADEPAYAF